MSKLATLGIYKIRSYGGDQLQTVSFLKNPVTLILGDNGCGKTTIIEAIRHSLCGSWPPGTKNGTSFITDPSIHNTTSTEALIKLSFRSHNNKLLLVTRAFSLKKTTNGGYTLRRTDQKIKTMGDDGETEVIDQKCAAIDKAIPNLLGVSKAVIENVLFCHQEDSLWPFGENIKLKSIFDDIFQTSKFSNMIQHLTKLKKHYKGKLKEEHIRLEGSRKAFEEMIGSMKHMQRFVKNLRDNMKSLREERRRKLELQEKISKEDNLEVGLAKLNSEFGLNSYKLEEKRKALKQKEATIIEFYTDNSREELNQTVGKLKEKLRECEQEMEKTEAELKRIYEQEKVLNETERVDIVEMRNQIKLYKKELLEKMEVEDEYPVEILLNKVLEFIGTKKGEKVSLTQNQDKNNQEITEQKIRLETLLEEKTRELEGVKIKIGKIEDSLKSKRDQNELITKKEDLNKELDSLIVERTAIGAEITKNNKKRDNLIQKMKEFQQLNKAYDDAKNVFEYKELEQSKIKLHRKLMSILDISKEKAETMQVYDIEKDLVKMSKGISQLKTDTEDLKTDKNTQEALKQLKQSEMAKIEEEMAQLKKDMEECPIKCEGHKNYFEMYSHLKRERDSLGASANVIDFIKSNHMHNHLLESSLQQGTCVLCRKEFNQADYNDAKELHEQLLKEKEGQDEGTQAPRNASSDYKRVKSQIATLKPYKKKFRRIQDLECSLAELSKEISELSDKSGLFNAKVAQNESKIEDVTQKKDQLQQCQNDLIKVIENHLKFEELGLGLDKKKHDMSTINSIIRRGRKETDQLALKMFEVDEDVKKLREQLNSKNSQIDKKRAQVSKVRRSISEMENNDTSSSREALYEAKDSLAAEIEEISKKLELASNQIEEGRRQGQEAVNLLDKTIYQLEGLQGKLREVSGVMSQLDSQDVEKFEMMNKDLETITLKKRNLETSLGNLRTNQSTLSKNIDSMEKYLQVTALQTEVKHLKQKDETLKASIAELEEKASKREGLKNSLNLLEGNLNKLKGREDTLKEEAKQTYNSMKKRRVAEKKYFDNLAQHQIYKKTIEDLEIYIESLEESLQIFHEQKISEVNATIAGIWASTYKGEDITKIEIKITPLEGSSKQSKKNFNYRVVFYQGEHVLDMRGRSSAGQRVLASIVIRIALAECFSENCEILALDEPTTNLDRDHIKILAQFLGNMIEERKETENFQLIIITHDSDFIQMLKEYTSIYFHVKKDEDQNSVIEKRPIASLA